MYFIFIKNYFKNQLTLMVRDDSACVEDTANTGSLYKHSNFIEDDEKLNEFDDILTRVGFGI